MEREINVLFTLGLKGIKSESKESLTWNTSRMLSLRYPPPPPPPVTFNYSHVASGLTIRILSFSLCCCFPVSPHTRSREVRPHPYCDKTATTQSTGNQIPPRNCQRSVRIFSFNFWICIAPIKGGSHMYHHVKVCVVAIVTHISHDLQEIL